jgi:CBS-domain-containing membrane protein
VKDGKESIQLKNIRKLPVTTDDNNIMVGMVTDKDILRAISKTMSLPTASGGTSLLTNPMQFSYRLM